MLRNTQLPYIGRFAPSPTGLLHFGSLLAAVASYLDAKANNGRWLLRIEDTDPPREHPEAHVRIPETLAHFGLNWDGDIVYQSQRYSLYLDVIKRLLNKGLAYRCSCSRKQIINRTGSTQYDGYCRHNPPADDTPAAIRLVASSQTLTFEDKILGKCSYNLQNQSGDFVIHRKDGLFSYQLAVVVDDYHQQISHIVRGSDLLEETPRQQQLQHYLSFPAISYAHIPVACNAEGQKLSKQNLAQPLDATAPTIQLVEALRFLGQQPPNKLSTASITSVLDWAIEHWQLNKIPSQREIIWQS